MKDEVMSLFLVWTPSIFGLSMMLIPVFTCRESPVLVMIVVFTYRTRPVLVWIPSIFDMVMMRGGYIRCRFSSALRYTIVNRSPRICLKDKGLVVKKKHEHLGVNPRVRSMSMGWVLVLILLY